MIHRAVLLLQQMSQWAS